MANKSTKADSIAKALETLGAKLDQVKTRDADILDSILKMCDDVDDVLAILGE